MSLPTFSMPSCRRHFFKGHKWWCRACDRETASQFREVCELWWRVPRDVQDALDLTKRGREMLTSSRTPLPLASEQDTLGEVYFQATPDEEDLASTRSVVLSNEVWRDMGGPSWVTVTIEPGDLLNAVEGGRGAG